MQKQRGNACKKAILFLHGGGNQDTWKPEISFARNYGKRTDSDVLYPIYPPFTEIPVADTAELIYEVYRLAAMKYGAANIAVVGGSYGGFLAMQLVTWINRNGNKVDMPGLLIMNSPFAFPETEEACACVSDAIQKAYARDGAVLHMHKEPGMMHCYACAPVFPESKRDYNKQIELIKKI